MADDDKGFSEETCVRCGWTMGQPPLNCQNEDRPHRFPSQEFDAIRTMRIGEALIAERDAAMAESNRLRVELAKVNAEL